MSNYLIKVKISDYFPKIDAIPFEYYICVISCNNYYSKIKLTEFKYQFFQHTFKLMKNTDLLFNIKLINYLENNTLIGIYDLLIPYTKVNQIMERNTSYYQQQIKLIMNSNVKIKLFGTMMNITSIYLDLIFEISLMENYTPSINKIRIYDILGNNVNELLNKNNNNNKIINNNINNKNQIHLRQKINFSKSPNYNNNNILYDLYNEDLNDKKRINNKNKDYNYNNNLNKEKHSDINYNVMNNNYLNYFQIDNNTFPLNYKININNKTPMNIPKNYLNIIENDELNQNIYLKLNNINNFSIPKEKNFIKNKNNINNIKGFKRNKNISRSPYLMDIERNIINNEVKKILKHNTNKNLTDAKNNKNNIETDIIRNERKKLELEQNKKNLKFQIFDGDSNGNNNNLNKLNYNNYIKNKKLILYDKKIHIEKYINNRLFKKIPNSIKGMKKKENLFIDTLDNNINNSELKTNNTFNCKIKTPKKKDSNSNINLEPSVNVSSIKECGTEFYTIENDKINKDKNVIKPYISLQNSNYKNIKKNYITKSICESNIKQNINENKDADIEIDKGKLNKRIYPKSNIIIENNNLELNKENDKLTKYSLEKIKDKAIQLLDDYIKSSKEIKEKMYLNKTLFKKLLLCKEKYYTELKINNRLNNKINDKNIKHYIHVNARGKLNEKLYFNMKKIKIKEFKIFEKIFYEHKNSQEYKAKEAKIKIKEKMEEQKKIHASLKLIRELIQKYENLSQLYNDDERKKMLFKSLLVRYGIREKEESKENNLMEKFNEIQKKIEAEKNNYLIKIKKKEIQNDVYKNVIKEEDDEERSSISEHMLKRGYSLKKKLSWASEDSVFKEKENLENNKSNNDDINNSILSSGLKIIRENNEEEILNKNDKNDEKINNIKESEIDNKDNSQKLSL